MGGEPYWYYVPYRDDLQAALDDLREREFRAGRYNPVIPFLDEFGKPGFLAQAPGAQHPSIDDAIEAAAEDGTRSILDIADIGPSPDYGTAAPFPRSILVDLYGTERPTRAMLDGNLGFLDEIQRGQAAYVIVYDGDRPAEILFAGYSYD